MVERAGPAGERDAPFIFDAVSPNLDERREIRGRERDREESREWNWEKLSLRRGHTKYTHSLHCLPGEKMR